MKKGLLIVFSGSSGVGKNTILKELFKDESLNLKYSVSATTRQMRENEVHGKDYFYLSPTEFNQKISNNEFLEYAEFVGNKYGTLKKQVEHERNLGHNVVLEIEVQGALNIMNKISDCLTIFIVPPSIKVLQDRLENRNTESSEEIKKRINAAKWEISKRNHYQHVLVNDTIDDVVIKLKKIIKDAC